MAIEYANQSGSQDEQEPQDNPAEESSEDETVDIPVSMLGGQKVSPGDVVRLEVTSVNEDSGTVTAKYAMSKKPGSAIDEAAKNFEA